MHDVIPLMLQTSTRLPADALGSSRSRVSKADSRQNVMAASVTASLSMTSSGPVMCSLTVGRNCSRDTICMLFPLLCQLGLQGITHAHPVIGHLFLRALWLDIQIFPFH